LQPIDYFFLPKQYRFDLYKQLGWPEWLDDPMTRSKPGDLGLELSRLSDRV
jgi:hypothetical protein